MTLYSSTQEMDNKIKEMYNTLCEILEDYLDEVDRSLSFTELVKLSENIVTEDFYYAYNTKPIDNIVFDLNDSLLRKEINIYYKIEFLIKYLRYIALVKGVPPEYIQQANTLREAIELLALINKLKPTVLSLDIQSNSYYYNSYCTIPYTITSEDEEVDVGNIIVLEDDIQIATIPVGEELKFLPTDIGVHEYTFYYEGSGIYRPSTPQRYNFNILPARIKLELSARNISKSQYYGNAHIGYDEDSFNLTIQTLNPYIDFPASNIPFSITVPQKTGSKAITGITDSDGIANIIISSNKIDTFDFSVQTTSDNNKITNASDTYNLTIYHNPIKIANYKFYNTQVDKEMELFFYDEEGVLTNRYINNDYHIIVDDTYRDFLLNNRTNPFIIHEEHTELGKYEYEYVLKNKNGEIIASTRNKVAINREIKIQIVPENKFLGNNTSTIYVHVYTTDYQDNPINMDVNFINSYKGLINTVHTINGHARIGLNISDIYPNKCSGFLLQAVAVEDEEVLSNTIYYRSINPNELNTELILECEESYNLHYETRTLHISAYLTDIEGDDVCRTIQVSDGVNNYNVNYDYNKKKHYKEIAIPEARIGDDISITVSYNGETNYYLAAISQEQNVQFIKSNVTFAFTYSQSIVYEELNISAVASIDDNPNFNKYITGDLKLTIDNEEIAMSRNNNVYNLKLTPLKAGNIEVMEKYYGNKWTNYSTTYSTTNVDKTDKYTFNVTLSDDEIEYGSNLILTPTLNGTTQIQQTFNGTITYEFLDGVFTRDLEPFTYTSTRTGNQSVTIIYNGDNNHYFKSITKTFIVKKLTPTLTLNVPEIDGTYRSDIDYKESDISYNGNDEKLRVKVYEDDIEKYNQSGKEHDEKIFNIISPGEHIIKLKTDETNIYNSLTIEKNIETYDFLEETYKMMNETNYVDEYSVEEKIEQILDCILNNTSNYDEDTLEGLYKILEHLED